MANPTGKGGFQKGQSGNPAGRLSDTAEVRALARQRTGEAFETLATIMADTGAPAAARVTAAIHILDRGWGRAAQPVTGAGGEGSIRITVGTGIDRD